MSKEIVVSQPVDQSQEFGDFYHDNEALPNNLKIIRHHWAHAQTSFSELLKEFRGNSDELVDFISTVASGEDVSEYQATLGEVVAKEPTNKKLLLLFAIVNNLVASSEQSKVIKNLMPFGESWKSYINEETFPRKFLTTLFSLDAVIPSLGVQTGVKSEFSVLQKHIQVMQEEWDAKLPPSLF